MAHDQRAGRGMSCAGPARWLRNSLKHFRVVQHTRKQPFPLAERQTDSRASIALVRPLDALTGAYRRHQQQPPLANWTSKHSRKCTHIVYSKFERPDNAIRYAVGAFLL